jgi:hypothetical protein
MDLKIPGTINYALYDPETGRVLMTGRTNRMETAEANAESYGGSIYLGHVNAETHLIIDGEPVPFTPSKPPEEIKEEILAATQQRLDDFARTRNYDGIMSAATYSTSTVEQFAAEGHRAVELRDQTWATLYQMLAEVQAGTRPMPDGYGEIEPELPALAWL